MHSNPSDQIWTRRTPTGISPYKHLALNLHGSGEHQTTLAVPPLIQVRQKNCTASKLPTRSKITRSLEWVVDGRMSSSTRLANRWASGNSLGDKTWRNSTKAGQCWLCWFTTGVCCQGQGGCTKLLIWVGMRLRVVTICGRKMVCLNKPSYRWRESLGPLLKPIGASFARA